MSSWIGNFPNFCFCFGKKAPLSFVMSFFLSHKETGAHARVTFYRPLPYDGKISSVIRTYNFMFVCQCLVSLFKFSYSDRSINLSHSWWANNRIDLARTTISMVAFHFHLSFMPRTYAQSHTFDRREELKIVVKSWISANRTWQQADYHHMIDKIHFYIVDKGKNRFLSLSLSRLQCPWQCDYF